MYTSIIRSILFALSSGDAERAHELARSAMKTVQRVPPLLSTLEWYCRPGTQRPVTHSGITFPSDIGVAAGFDKQGEVIPCIEAMGFGFAEIGTILPRPQSGNPRPRMFRLPRERALINRMGFNSLGVEAVVRNLEMNCPKVGIPLGISLSKNKDTELTPEATAADCVATLQKVSKFVSYITICLSSPNTPNLRNLQAAEAARRIVRAVLVAEKELAGIERRDLKPVLVKITCDMNDEDMGETVEACRREGVAGFVASNTTFIRPFRSPKPRHADEDGGLSGPPLHQHAVATVKHLRAIDNKMLIMGVGGVEDRESYERMREAGADVIQLLTGLIYRGPRIVREILD